MIIRSYNEADLDKVINLFYNTVHSINIKDYSQEQVNAWAPKAIDKTKWGKSLLSNYSLIVEVNGQVVGFGDLEEGGYLDRLYVHKDYQGIGVGNMICNCLEEEARAQGHKSIETHGSITAKPFFISRGYRIVKEQQVEVKGIYMTNFIMVKNLKKDESI
ncbi:MAG: GNAT family N-acetyltransferase [Clostridium sp.]|uniref:GNAT family N-acetyltransferase n=2 Tax=Clostridium sp. TaxID=1506 RepID=UPI002FC6461D